MVHQLLSDSIPSAGALTERFNEFLFNLTVNFAPLPASTRSGLGPVPAEYLVTHQSAYKALRNIKVKKSPGPETIPNVIWKDFAFELCPVISDLYNASLEEDFIPDKLKESLVYPVPKCSPQSRWRMTSALLLLRPSWQKSLKALHLSLFTGRLWTA